jgi:hypothetical protein
MFLYKALRDHYEDGMNWIDTGIIIISIIAAAIWATIIFEHTTKVN